MSNQPSHCPKCQVDGVVEAVVPFEPERESLFAVSWQCPQCGERLRLVVSPLGPWLVPTAGMCLQCGHTGVKDGQACESCGIRISEVLSDGEAARPEAELLLAARDDFARGTCRRGLTLVNHVLRRNPFSEEAWSIKGQFFDHLGFQRALKAAMQEAARLRNPEHFNDKVRAAKHWWQFWK